MRAAAVIALVLAQPLAAQEFFTLKGHGGPIMDVTVSPSGQIATASFDNAVGVWDEDGPRWLEGHRAAVNAVGFLSDDLIASAGDDNALWLWTKDGLMGRQVAQHTAKIVDIAYDAPRGRIATASWDATIGLTRAQDLDGPVEGWQVDQTIHLKGHRQGVNAIAFTRDGGTLYSASVDGTIRSWDMSDPSAPSKVIVKHGFGVNELVVNDTDGWLAYGASDGGTRMIDLETREKIADFTLERRPILALAFHDKTGTLAVGDGQGYIMIVDTHQRQITHDFRASQNGPVWALAFSKGGQNIHAGGIEDILYSWPIETMDTHGPMTGAKRSFLQDPKSLPNGERQFKRKCSICHTVTEGSARKAGPSLHQLFGRRAGTVPDYSYSDTLEGSTIIWNAQSINALFNDGPDHYIPGTKMPMQRIAKQSDRDDLIDYLRTATVQGEN